MGHHQISKLLNGSTASIFVTIKWIQVNHSLNGEYSDKNIRLKTSMLKTDLRYHSIVYMLLWKLTFEGKKKSWR